MTKTYNLYFGKDSKPVEYFKPRTVDAELQNLVDNPDQYETLKQDHADEVKALKEDKADLTQERDDLKDDVKDLKAELKEFTDFLKDEVGYNTIAELRTALNGEKLPDILVNMAGDIKTLRDYGVKVDNDVATLKKTMANMVKKDVAVKLQQTADKAVADLGNLQGLYDPLKRNTDDLNAKWKVADLVKLDELIDVLNTNNKVRLQIINKYGVGNMGELDNYIQGVETARDRAKNKITNAKGDFEAIVKAVNKTSTAIFADINKKKIKKNMDNVKNALGYNDIDAISDQED